MQEDVSAIPPAGSVSAETEEFLAFVKTLSDAELASVYSGYRFLAQLGSAGDIRKRDACEKELDARFREKSPSTAMSLSAAAGVSGVDSTGTH